MTPAENVLERLRKKSWNVKTPFTPGLRPSFEREGKLNLILILDLTLSSFRVKGLKPIPKLFGKCYFSHLHKLTPKSYRTDGKSLVF